MEQPLLISKDKLRELIEENVKIISRKTIDKSDIVDIYSGVCYAIKDLILDKWIATHDDYDKEDVKVVYYLSMEFLMGRFLGNNVLNLNFYTEFKEVLLEMGFDPNLIEEQEPDPGLGNGGLGRLAACFLESLSTLSIPAYGCGILYHYGIFEQRIENGYQVEYPDDWLKNGNPWAIKRREYTVEVKFGGTTRAVKDEKGKVRFIQENYQSVMAVPYDYPVVGYGNNTVNTLRLWDAEPSSGFDLKSFNEGNYQKAAEAQNLADTLTRVLYPADDHYSGKELRLRQQYFFISATIQRVIERFKKTHGTGFEKLPDKVQFQLNDTHPSIAVAELMRMLVDENGMDWDDAWEVTTKTCAYTNHTIMSEALEKWPIELFSRLLPRIYQIVEEINRRFCLNLNEYYGDPEKIRKMAIVADGQIRMAHLAIVGSHSVNGVAALHTEILKNQELKDFYEIYPQKFNNKTNGITQRRWLCHANPKLAKLITDTIGDGFITNLDELKKLIPYSDDKKFKKQFMDIKHENKVFLANYIEEHKGVKINPDSIFDIQVKRLHEYKRQLLNVLHIMFLYNQIKMNPALNITPRTFIFGAKAAASYYKAKQIIKLINAVGDIINNDKTIDDKIKVIFMENYSVSLAEKMIVAADVSEQISTASKEASGTGNMKFMLNGALTIGTLDGANVEIHEEVGDDNIFLFGLHAADVIELSKTGEYNPWDIYNMNVGVRMVMTDLINGSISGREGDIFRDIYNSLLNPNGKGDEYFVLKDFDDYRRAQQEINDAFLNKDKWAKMAIMNTACAGKFSSDRTIMEYAKEVWNVEPFIVKM